MRAFLSTAFALILLAACRSTEPSGKECGNVDYCPGCKTFCGADCPKTDAGTCKACGKAPAAVEGCELSWLWCSHHKAWHAEKACKQHDDSKCCEAAKPSMALCIPRDAKDVVKAKYCPQCRCFCGSECPLDAQGSCKRCGRPPVEADAYAGAWHWCVEHKRWHRGQPCDDHAAKKCCDEVKSYVLVCHPR